MKKVLIIGGTSGLGLSIALNIKEADKISIVGRHQPDMVLPDNISFEKWDLNEHNLSFLNKYRDIDTLIFSAGFGRLALFEDLSDEEIISYFNVNTVSAIRIIKFFYEKIKGNQDFYCAVIGSIAGFMSSPFFSVYGATKAALKIFIESVNVEIEKAGSDNRILNVVPGAIKGTKFNNGTNNLELTVVLAQEIIEKMTRKEDLYIPQYEEVFKNVLERYHEDFRKEGLYSYDYKLKSGRIKNI